LLEELEAVWQGRVNRIGEILAEENQGGPHPWRSRASAKTPRPSP
jgi:hypothetical protein